MVLTEPAQESLNVLQDSVQDPRQDLTVKHDAVPL